MPLVQILITAAWQALAYTFAIMPGIVAIAYILECRQYSRIPNLADYLRMMVRAERGKSRAYHQVALDLVGGRLAALIVATVIWIVVALIGPGIIFTAVGNVALMIAAVLLHLIIRS